MIRETRKNKKGLKKRMDGLGLNLHFNRSLHFLTRMGVSCSSACSSELDFHQRAPSLLPRLHLLKAIISRGYTGRLQYASSIAA